ncbi:MAG TPA: HesA/MoeB/ThiF family protein [Spirochaetota bacterium]|nr:HesA/MoeB/ThiF family protein [Spirochaetota bacterium]HPC41815.1 HesA/MoeB/ThiF family protein [Spirochaetota bacterium]HPL16153.1 HesA/MoeB/ThiF family protein [Spirochaetota bacterium]HQF07536.1 HesA/MoeB/ThiF family protein [Spirochaetota bacterium]HQH96267.1 HesA/MoeB/ThiF family protein [Spirochaetota bacterium]
MLLKEELLFYSRQLGIPSWGAPAQEKLKNSRVFVAGTGGLGSPVLYYLAAAGVGTIIICDYDTIEITNLNRQILHRYGKIGYLKVDSAREALNELNPFITVTPVKEKLTAKNAGSIIGDPDIIIDCLDNFEARHIINRISVEKSIPLVHAGVAELRGQITFMHPPETPCLACFLDHKSPKKKPQVLGATAGVIGSLQAVEAIKHLAGFAPSLKNRLLFWDGLAMKFESISIKRNTRCKVCKNF